MPVPRLAEFNALAVMVAAAATFFLGGLWYTVLFGKLWQRLHGYSDEQLKAMKIARPPQLFFGVMIGSYALLAVVMAQLVVNFNVNTAAVGAWLGFMLWLGPAVAVRLTGHIASDKRFGTCVLDLAYQLVYFVMMGAILGAWR